MNTLKLRPLMATFSHIEGLWKCSRANAGSVAGRDAKEKVKTGLLMLNMGGPSSLKEVNGFLTRLFTDPDLIPLPVQSKLGPLIANRRSPSIEKKYAEIGGGSPIKKWTQRQGQLLVNLLDKTSRETAPHKAYVGFRYAEPLMEAALEEMERDGVERAIAFSQYPQYSCSTSGSSFNALAKYYTEKRGADGSKMQWSLIDRWPINRGLIESVKDLVLEELNKFPPGVANKVVLLFSAHSLPQMVVNRGDTYPSEVASTVIQVMEALDWKYPYRLVWQSKVGPLPWLSPHTDDAMRGFVKNGHKNFLIVPISFVNEHIETLHELDIEYGQELAQELKIDNIRRVPAPNDHPKFIQGLADQVKDHMARKEICSKQLMIRCPLCTKPSCSLTRSWIASLSSVK